MPNIVAGRFGQQADADAAVAELKHQGVTPDHVSSFFVNPPGQHARFPLGGDRLASPGATAAGAGAAVGAAMGGVVGAGVGLAAAPVLGPDSIPVAAGVGAWVGSLAGALGKMEDEPADADPYLDAPAQVRHAGVMVAAYAPDAQLRTLAVEVLQSRGAQDIETAEGVWRDGKWIDFDPLAPPGASPADR